MTPSERNIQWAATMHGHHDGEVRRAHSDTASSLSPIDVNRRDEREAAEDAALAPGATRSSGGGHRAVDEAPDPSRTCFERDRDRILHATSFRRLAGKTQVFVFPEDHQRTRMTHALEVAQVATSIARACRLNVALTEAIALGHDCGHGPGGHASEDAFEPYLDEGYDHAVWGADVVLAPLNLCVETLDGIRNHSWSRPAPATPEGEVVSWADRIAYVCHDFEDAAHIGIVSPDSLPELVRDTCGTTRREQLAAFINGVVDTTCAAGVVGADGATADALSAFRRFNYERIYMRDESVTQADQVIRILRALVDHYTASPSSITPPTDEVPPGSAAAARAAVTHVGGMTDRYAFDTAVSRLGWDPAALPRGIDAHWE